jgi:hypothetical protein
MLFQSAVINKHLKTLDKKAVRDAFIIFQQHFQNATVQANIRNSKEKQYQEGFLNHLFVNVLGYTYCQLSTVNYQLIICHSATRILPKTEFGCFGKIIDINFFEPFKLNRGLIFINEI